MSLYDEVHHKYKLACTELREATEALDDPAVNNIRTLPEGIRLLRAENERLRGLVRDIYSYAEDQSMETLMDIIDAARVDTTVQPSDALDAARYRFLRQPGNAIVYAKSPNAWGEGASGHVRYDTPENLDDAVDKARTADQQAAPLARFNPANFGDEPDIGVLACKPDQQPAPQPATAPKGWKCTCGAANNEIHDRCWNCNGVETWTRAADQQPAHQPEAVTCAWYADDEGYWSTGCGKALCYNEAPDFEEYPYCPACSKRIAVQPALETCGNCGETLPAGCGGEFKGDEECRLSRAADQQPTAQPEAAP